MSILNIVAHQDDDLLFLSPDLQKSIRLGERVQTVYLTAGDAGLPDWYWREREIGVQVAYAEIARASNEWAQFEVKAGAGSIMGFRLSQQQDISLAFMRLPEGGFHGSGYPLRRHQSLRKLWDSSIGTIDAIDLSASYTLTDLIDSISRIISDFGPKQINTLDFKNVYGDGDHSDHHAVAYLTRAAMARCDSQASLTGYEGYPTLPLPANVSGAELAEKREIFFKYARHDKQLQEILAYHPYEQWLARQYRTDEPRPLIAKLYLFIWRVLHYAWYSKNNIIH